MKQLKPLPVRLSAEERAALESLCRRDGVPLAGLVRWALREYLKGQGVWPPASWRAAAREAEK